MITLQVDELKERFLTGKQLDEMMIVELKVQDCKQVDQVTRLKSEVCKGRVAVHENEAEACETNILPKFR
jgi:hypothetical protein